MQNYNNAPPPQVPYGGPPPKKGMSTGVKVVIVIAAVLVVGFVGLLALGGVGYYWLSRQAQEAVSQNPAARAGLAGSGAAGAEAEPPQPTSEQSAAVAGGQTAAWSQQEISWTVPQRWKQNTAESTSFMWRSPGSWDAASLIVNISPMANDFPADISLNAAYDQAMTRKQQGEVNEVKWLLLDGVKGVMFRESAPESDDNPQRLQWIAFRTYKGQTQMLNVMLASRGKDFARHEDALYGILYSTKLAK